MMMESSINSATILPPYEEEFEPVDNLHWSPETAFICFGYTSFKHRGYSKDKISVDDYIRLASGLDVTNEFKKPWVKSFTNGVVIPKDDDKQKKVFRSYLNFVKRKAPNSEGIMYPYNDGKEFNDYLTIQEENEEC
ncbi:hypothetical protein LOTGIDRAFT_163228 [Lottia gigantea]|uniref:Uncharacterized protein n=1 Tax=Lottia gigantea TaxID=225164 RepID=V4A5B3_LOTGI|nr:hypothetical protein LOTGIDRAFT_163228 [Lottia gigantea]ESO91867.1 hypothetical protein LOTGIDRAFT_163228 [Lottia gigantea]